MHIMCVCHEPMSNIEDVIRPAMQALTADGIFNHSNLNIQVVVASCVYEIIRICIQKLFPHTKAQMKKCFELFMVSFKQLSFESTKHYGRAVRMLENMAKLKSYLIFLDLAIEIDSVVVEMFQVFLDAIRPTHSSDIFNHMKNIMITIIEESDDISADLLMPLLSSVKIDNKVENEEIPRFQAISEEVVNSQFEASDASGDGVLKLDEKYEAGPEMQIQAERSRRVRKPNTLMRWEEAYQRAWLVRGSGNKKDSLLPSKLRRAEISSDSSLKEIDSLRNLNISRRGRSKEKCPDRLMTTNGVVVGCSTAEIDKEHINLSADAIWKHETAITSEKFDLG